MGTLLLNPEGGVLPISKATVAETGVQMRMPMWIGETENTLWLLPVEPLVAVRGRNVITRRTIAKLKDRSFGSVKELWSKDDYEVVINGMLNDYLNPDELPAEMISRLDNLCSLRKPLIVRCALLEALGIGQIVIDGWEFPTTEGISDQSYSIRAFSDQNFNLLIDN